MDLNLRNSPNDEINQKAQPVQFQPPPQQNSAKKPRKKKRLKRNQLNMSEQSSNLSMSQDPNNGLGQFETDNRQSRQMHEGGQRPGLNIKQNQFQTGVNNQQPLQMRQPQNNGLFSPGRSGKGSASKNRKKRPKKPKNKFMQPMNRGPNGQPMVQPNQFQTQSQLPQNIQSNLNQMRGPPNDNFKPPQHQNINQMQQPDIQMNQNRGLDARSIQNTPNRGQSQHPPKQNLARTSHFGNDEFGAPPPQQNAMNNGMNNFNNQSQRMTPQAHMSNKMPAEPSIPSPGQPQNDDPFKDIGFSNSGFNKSDQNAFPEFNIDQSLDMFPMGDNKPAQQNNTNDDPFAELIPKEENTQLAIEAPQSMMGNGQRPQQTPQKMPIQQQQLQHRPPPQQQVASQSLGFGQPQPSQSMPQNQNDDRKSTEYNFDDEDDQNSFAFDEINIDLGDLNLGESPAPKVNQPPETKRKQSVNSGLPLESSRSNNSIQQNNPNLQNFNMGNDMPVRNMRNIQPQQQQLPPQNQGFGQNHQPDPGMFNTVVADNNRTMQPQTNSEQFDMFGNSNMHQPQPPQQQPPQQQQKPKMNNGGPNMQSHDQNMDNQLAIMPEAPSRQENDYANPNNFNTIVNTNTPNLDGFGQNMDYGNQRNMNNQNQNMMSQNMPKPNGPSPHDFMTSINMQSTNHATMNFGGPMDSSQNDPFAQADSAGFNGDSLAMGFNTMAPGKPKRKNPFAKSNQDDSSSFFQSNNNNVQFSNAGGNGPQEFSDLFSSSAATSSNHPQAQNMGGNFGTKDHSDFGNPHNNAANPNMFKIVDNFDPNLAGNMHRGESFGMGQPQNQPPKQDEMFGFNTSAAQNPPAHANKPDDDPFADLFT